MSDRLSIVITALGVVEMVAGLGIGLVNLLIPPADWGLVVVGFLLLLVGAAFNVTAASARARNRTSRSIGH